MLHQLSQPFRFSVFSSSSVFAVRQGLLITNVSVGAVPSTPPLSPGGGRGVLREAVVVALSSGTSPASQTDTRGGGSTWMYGEGLSPRVAWGSLA